MRYRNTNLAAFACWAFTGFVFTTPLLSQTDNVRWSGFQNGGEFSIADAQLPVKWSTDQGIVWQTKLAGYGQSTPVYYEDSIYVTSVSGEMKDQIHVQAIDRITGRESWQYQSKNSSPEKSTPMVSRAAPSPVSDAEGVICFFEGGNIVALTHDGQVRWETDLTKLHGDVKARHGVSASLEQNDENLFVWIERMEKPYVVAINKKTGETAWKSDGLGTTSWSSPRLVPVGQSHHLVLSGIGKIAGYDPVTGKRLWDFDKISGNSTPTPVPLGNGRFLIGASVGRGEDGGGKAAESNGVIEISESDGQYSADWVWQAQRATSSFGSPAVHNGKAYFVNRQGVVYCLDVENGNEIYMGRASSGSIWATPIASGDQIYLFGKNGTTTVLKDAKELTPISTNKLWAEEKPQGDAGGPSGGSVLYAAAPIGSQLLLRRGDILYLVGN